MNNPCKEIENTITLEDIAKFRKIEQIIRAEEISYFQDTIEVYFSLMKQAANLIKELGLPQNSISYSYIIEWLINDGVLSYSSSFDHQDDIEDKGHRTVL